MMFVLTLLVVLAVWFGFMIHRAKKQHRSPILWRILLAIVLIWLVLFVAETVLPDIFGNSVTSHHNIFPRPPRHR
jgi:H+/Cl- antiporter ClcA